MFPLILIRYLLVFRIYFKIKKQISKKKKTILISWDLDFFVAERSFFITLFQNKIH